MDGTLDEQILWETQNDIKITVGHTVVTYWWKHVNYYFDQ